MHWQRGATPAALLLAWGLLAAWQGQEYRAECEAARETVRRQAESVMNALVGGVQSHRRLGRFVEEQLQGLLDELAKAQDVVAVAMISADRRITLTAGKADLLDLAAPVEPGHAWDAEGFRYAVAFQVAPDMPFPGPIPGPGPMPPGPNASGPMPAREPPAAGPIGPMPGEPPRGQSRFGFGPGGMGQGPGRPGDGRGRPPGWQPDPNQGPLAAGGRFVAVLLLDRARADRQIAHYAWLRVFVVFAGGIVILSAAFAWRATMRLAEARGRASLLEIEARHLRDLSQAAAGLAHETRNPLGLIRGWTQRLAQSLPESPQQREQAQSVIEECDRVTARINQFLAFARPCDPRTTSVRPVEIVSELAALLEPDLIAKRLTLAPAVAEPGRAIKADREMFRQCLFNLIQNAVAFSPEGGAVDVIVKPGENGSTRVEVADHGPGVAPEAAERLFTPYHTTRSNGTGLGLAIVRRIATVHGWEAGYTPRPGGGSIFWLDGIHD